MGKQVPPDVLAERYATEKVIKIWSPENKTILLRSLWVFDLKAREKFGLPIPNHQIAAYETVLHKIDLDSITARELRLKHDVMANIEEFNELAGFQVIHRGFTSRDETDNTEQLQILQSLKLMLERSVTVLLKLKCQMLEFRELYMAGRSHNVPGQVITLGKRLGNWAQELIIAIRDLEQFIAEYPMRGIKGPMGTQQDMVAQLGNKEKALEYENLVREYFGFSRVLTCVGQVYPRMLDFKATHHAASLASGPANFALMVRLMAGNELAHEGFKDEQVGSSGMPHKINSRTCERIRAFLNVIKGFHAMTSGLLGDQWYEGDVSCSVVRRVALPGTFYALDGLFEATMHVLDEMEIFPHMIEQELKRFLPFLSTTALLTNATKKGMGREEAHKIIKEAAVKAVKGMREGQYNHFLSYLSDSGKFTMSESKEITDTVDVGTSLEQVDQISAEIEQIKERYPAAMLYQPSELR